MQLNARYYTLRDLLFLLQLLIVQFYLDWMETFEKKVSVLSETVVTTFKLDHQKYRQAKLNTDYHLTEFINTDYYMHSLSLSSCM